MSKTKTEYPNHLTRYRERLGFTQEDLAKIVGCRRAQTISRIENGQTLPGLVTALKLAAAVRTPLEFIYHDTFISLREDARANEERLPKGRQGVLPLLT